jgi:xylitol oxidase
MTDAIRNWAGNIAFAASAVQAPGSLDELQQIVRSSRKVRALGSRHSFNRIADTPDALVSMRAFNKVIGLDAGAQTVTVEGGITYGELCPWLDAQGFALRNLASLPHISVVGAVATATHGSGSDNQNLAAAVSALTLLRADATTVTLKRGDADFAGAVVGLGALGIVTAVTLEVVPRFAVREDVYLDLPFAALCDNFDAVMGSAYSVSCFTHWQGDSIARVWLKSLADGPAPPRELFGARPADRPWHPIEALDPAPATAQMGVPGPWYLRLPHFRIEFQPSSGDELQTEYFVPRAQAADALRALRAIGDRIAPHLLVSELRTVAADKLWLSMCYGQPSLALHFTWKPDWPGVRKVLPEIEAALAPFGVRPHWGKLFTLDKPTLAARTPRLDDFRALAERFDPEGRFRNVFLDETVF